MNNKINNRIVLFVASIILLSIIGCSGKQSNSVMPSPTENENNLPGVENTRDQSNHYLLGTCIVEFDIESLTSTVTQNRELNIHYNVTTLIPDPLLEINSWNPATATIDVDVSINNPYFVDVYDVRLIIYTDNAGHRLLNDDNWTSLYDIPEGLSANPFKAYAKQVMNRKFAGNSWESENLLIRCPGSNFTVQFAIDASYPGNCEEPYEIIDFAHGFLSDDTGASATAEVTVRDWQDNVNAVELHCPEVVGVTPVSFEYDANDRWTASIMNNTGASVGDYPGYIAATSSDSAVLVLYDEITIKISDENLFSWVVTLEEGGYEDDKGYALLFDDFDNVLVSGHFTGTIDFDPGPGVVEVGSHWAYDEHNLQWYPTQDAFIAKFDRAGNFMWVDVWGDDGYDRGLSMASDNSGNVYVTGFESLQFFLRKYTTFGDLLLEIGWPGRGFSVDVDEFGDIYVAGIFKGQVDFDPGPGFEWRTSNGGDDIFLCKLNPNFELLWVITVGSTSSDDVIAVCLDESLGVCLAGFFQNSVDFDPGTGVDQHTSAGHSDVFLCRYLSSGDLDWALSWGSEDSEFCTDMTVSDSEDIFVAGYFRAPIDLDPGSGIDMHIPAGNYDAFMSKFSNGGDYLWGKTWGGTNTDYIYGITFDLADRILVTGTFKDIVDFDPGPDSFEITAYGAGDCYLSRFTDDGDFIWTRRWGGEDSEYSEAVAVDSYGFIHTTGSYWGLCDFDPGPGTVEYNAVGKKFYVLKLNSDGYWE